MTIAEVCKRYDIPADTLRYYERVNLIPSVNRTQSGIRNYTEADCRWVEFVKCLRSSGIQVKAVVEYVALFQQGESTSNARMQILIEQRDMLAEKMDEMQKTLERLNAKIERYEQLNSAAEQDLKIV